MRTIIKQERFAAGGRNAAMTGRAAGKNPGVRNAPLHTSGGRSLRYTSQAGKSHVIRLLNRFDPCFGIELDSSNDAHIPPVPDVPMDAVGLVPVQHQSAISYITTCQPSRRLVYVSPQISKLGFSPEDVQEQPDIRFRQAHEEDLPRIESAWQNLLQEDVRFDCQYRLYDSAGHIRWFHDQARVIRDKDGMRTMIEGVMLDITDKKRLEAEVEGYRYYLERNVEQRTAVLTKRLELLESCNASLCTRLSAARMEIAELKRSLEQFVPSGEALQFA